VLSWQQIQEGEKVAASPWIQRLQLTLRRAGLGELPVHAPERAVTDMKAALPVQPQPSAPGLIPETLSASGYDALVACPYQFFASRMLGPRAADPLRELPEKRDYGDWLHAILKQYHATLRDRPVPHSERHALMASISDAVFNQVLAHNPAALSWQARWQARRDAYVDWADQQEAEGWRYQHGEHPVQRPLGYGERSIELYGKLDRVDRDGNGEQRVLDYKTTAKDTLKKRLKEHDDHQLPFYGLLLGPAPVAAGYVAIDDETPALLPAKDLDAWRELLRVQLQDNLAAIADGAHLVANGSGDSCTYCDMNGLCRKGYW